MIYLLEDDESIRNFVEYALNNSGLESRGFEKPSDFWKGVDESIPALVILDVMLPEEDGLEVLKKIRNRSDIKNVPVIMLTAKDTEYDKVIGLDTGADDYVAKPFGMMELISRIKALMRRVLTYKEFELLCLLISNKGTVFNRDQILQRIWGFEFDGENRTVDVHIRTLRTKLGECGALIETVRGIGYKIGG